MLTAVNFGPGEVFCQSVLAKNATVWRRLTRRVENWFIVNESPQLPQKLAAGEPLNVLIAYEKGCVLAKPLTHLGITDSFGRMHWMSRRELKKARARYHKDFPSET